MASTNDRISVHVRVRGGDPHGPQQGGHYHQQDGCVHVQTVPAAKTSSSAQSSTQGVVTLGSSSSSSSSSGGDHAQQEAVQPFAFDTAFDANATQEDVFERVGLPACASVLEGYHGTVLAYGQTGSGKTHTMQGPSSLVCGTQRGLIPRALEFLFTQMKRNSATKTSSPDVVGDSGGGADTCEAAAKAPALSLSYKCTASVLEIYGEKVIDLSSADRRSCPLHEDNAHQVYAKDLVQTPVRCADDALAVLQNASAHRTVAETSANSESSRSHLVYTLTVQAQWRPAASTNSFAAAGPVVRTTSARLNLVDLAGSERQKFAETEGTTLREACNINQSLAHLGRVVRALSTTSDRRHIPFRDSKLTYLLRASLGGNSKTHLIANISPEHAQFAETLSTLKFAANAKRIRCNATVNRNIGGSVTQLQAEVRRLEALLAHQQQHPHHQHHRQQLEGAESLAGLVSNDEGVEHDQEERGRASELEQILGATMKRIERERANYEEKLALLQESNELLHEVAQKREARVLNTQMIVKLREAELKRLRAHNRAGADQQPKSDDDSGEAGDDEILRAPSSIEAVARELRAQRQIVDQHPEAVAERERNIELQYMYEHVLGLVGVAQRDLTESDGDLITLDEIIEELEHGDAERRQLEQQVVRLLSERDALRAGTELELSGPDADESSVGNTDASSDAVMQERIEELTRALQEREDREAELRQRLSDFESELVHKEQMSKSSSDEVAQFKDRIHELSLKLADKVLVPGGAATSPQNPTLKTLLDGEARRSSLPGHATATATQTQANCDGSCASSRYDEHVAEVFRLEAKLASAESEKEAVRRAARQAELDAEGAAEEAETVNATLRHELSELRKESAGLADDLQQSRTELLAKQELEKRNQELEETVARYTKEMQEMQCAMEAQRGNDDERSAQIIRMTEEIHNLRVDLNEAEDRAQRDATACGAAQLEITALERGNTELQEATAQARAELVAASTMLAEVRSDKLQAELRQSEILKEQEARLERHKAESDARGLELQRARVSHATVLREIEESHDATEQKLVSELSVLRVELADALSELETVRRDQQLALLQPDTVDLCEESFGSCDPTDDVTPIDVDNVEARPGQIVLIDEDDSDTDHSDSDDATGKSSSLTEKLAKIRHNSRTQLRKAIGERDTALAASEILQSTLNNREAKLKQLELDHEAMRGQKDKLEADCAQLRTVIEGYQQRLSKHAATGQSATQELTVLRTNVAQLQGELFERDAQLAKMEEAIQEEAQRLTDRATHALKTKLKVVKDDLLEAHEEVTRMSQLRNTAQKIRQFERVQRMNFELTQENEDLKTRVDELSSMVRDSGIPSDQSVELAENQAPNADIFAMPSGPASKRFLAGGRTSGVKQGAKQQGVGFLRPTSASSARRSDVQTLSRPSSQQRARKPTRMSGVPTRVGDEPNAASDPAGAAASFVTTRR